MDLSRAELAGVVDLFGALTRAELGRALSELAYKQSEERDSDDFEAVIDGAVESYHLVSYEAGSDGERRLVPGPIAFPELPENAEDLPHIMDVANRAVDREAAGRAAAERFRTDAARAVSAGDAERMRELLDVSYELEVWAPVELDDARARLDDVLS